MTGLRARQKADRSRRILDASVACFRERGYRDVRIEDLAAVAGVSVGTVYNYYRTKGDILMAIVSMEVEEVLAAGAQVVEAPPSGVHDALLALIWRYYDHSLEWLSKEMWRAAMAISIEAPDTPNGQRWTALDARLCAQVADLIGALQRRGEVRRGVDAVAVGDLAFNNLNMMFVEFIKDDAMTMETLKARVARQTRPLAQAIAAPEAVA